MQCQHVLILSGGVLPTAVNIELYTSVLLWCTCNTVHVPFLNVLKSNHQQVDMVHLSVCTVWCLQADRAGNTVHKSNCTHMPHTHFTGWYKYNRLNPTHCLDPATWYGLQMYFTYFHKQPCSFLPSPQQHWQQEQKQGQRKLQGGREGCAHHMCLASTTSGPGLAACII